MSNVSRSVYQKVAEENKQLKKDLYILLIKDDSLEADLVARKWLKKFKEEVEFRDLMQDFAKQYSVDHPEVALRAREGAPSIEEHWQRMGKRYGYPQCCIDSFINESSPEARTENQKLVSLLQTGFIPCEHHANLLVKGEISLISLISHERDLSLPKFPMG